MSNRPLLVGAVVLTASILGSASIAAAAGPILSWSPTTTAGAFDYGTVAPGGSASTTFTLRNSGGASTSGLTTTLSGSTAFAIMSDRCRGTSLPPGRSCLVRVRYTPVAGVPSDSASLAAVGRKPNTSAILALQGTSVRPRHIYWANAGVDTIGRATVDGTGVNQDFITGSILPQGMAIDGLHLWWANGAASVGRADLDGQNVLAPFFPVVGSIFGVEVDADHVYWPHTDPDPALTGIGRADLDGRNADPGFITGTIDPFDVAVDAVHIYWTDCGANAIGRADLDGQNANMAFITGASCPIGVAVDGGHVYWTSFGTNSIGRADIGGQNADPTFISGATFPFAITVDSAHIYWANVTGNSIGRADLNGGGVNQAFLPADLPRGLTVDPG